MQRGSPNAPGQSAGDLRVMEGTLSSRTNAREVTEINRASNDGGVAPDNNACQEDMHLTAMDLRTSGSDWMRFDASIIGD